MSLGVPENPTDWMSLLPETKEYQWIGRHLGRSAISQRIGKDVPRAQRTPMGNPYISPI